MANISASIAEILRQSCTVEGALEGGFINSITSTRTRDICKDKHNFIMPRIFPPSKTSTFYVDEEMMLSDLAKSREAKVSAVDPGDSEDVATIKFMGFEIQTVAVAPTEPVLKLSHDLGEWCTDAFRSSINAWLLERFGMREIAVFLTEQQRFIMSKRMLEKVQRDIDRAAIFGDYGTSSDE